MRVISPQLLFFVLLSFNVFSQKQIDSLRYYYTLDIPSNKRYELINEKIFSTLEAGSELKRLVIEEDYLLAQRTHDLEAVSFAELSQGSYYLEINNESVALFHYYNALKGFEATNNRSQMALASMSIGQTYKVMEDYQKSFDFINKSIQLKESLGEKDYFYYASLIHLANAAKELKNYKTAFEVSKISLEYFKEYPFFSVYLENNLGYYYLELFKELEVDSLIAKNNIKSKQQLLDSSLHYYKGLLKTSSLLESKKEINKWNAFASSGLGVNSYLREDYAKAIKYLEITSSISEELILPNQLLKTSYENLYLSYKGLGNSDKALFNYQKFIEYRDKIQSDENKRALFKQDLVYKHEKELKVKEDNIKAKNRLIIITITSFIVLLVIVVLLIKRRQLLKDKKSKEKFAHDLLMTQENERKRISEDLHDGLGQSLLFVKNEIVSKNHEKSKELINSSIEEMRTIARSLYPFQLNNVGIVRAIDNLIVQLNDSTQGIYFFSEIKIKDDTLNTIQKVNTFRIVQECLSNIVKHSKGTSAKVSLTTKNQKVIIRIQDNGVGFNFSKKYNVFNTLGLKTIQERVNFLKGTLDIDSEKGKGTSFSIIFPIII